MAFKEAFPEPGLYYKSKSLFHDQVGTTAWLHFRWEPLAGPGLYREASSGTRSLPPMHLEMLLQPKHFFSQTALARAARNSRAWLQESRLQHPHVQEPQYRPPRFGRAPHCPPQSVVPCACCAPVGKNVRRREGRAVLSTCSSNTEGPLFLLRLP